MPSLEKHKAIKGLPEDKLNSVRQLLRRGETATRITKLIQADWGLLSDMQPETLQKNLIRYRQDLLREGVDLILRKANVLDELTGLAKDLDVTEELHRLYYVQRSRMEKLLAHENLLPAQTLLKEVNDQIALLGGLLDKIGKLHLETGVKPRAPRVLQGQIEPVDDKGTMKFRMTESAQKMIDAFLGEDNVYVTTPSDDTSA